MAGSKLLGRKSGRALAIILALALIFSAMPITTFGDSGDSSPDREYVTVRIETGGLGVDAEGESLPDIDTLLEETIVDLSELDSQDGYKAIDAVNLALEKRGLEKADDLPFHESFGGVSVNKQTHYWSCMKNDKALNFGLDDETISAGDSIVIFINNFITEAPAYSYFVQKSVFFNKSDELSTPNAEISLQLLQIMDWDGNTGPVENAEITVTASNNNYEFQDVMFKENGLLKFTCWEEGEYDLSATKIVDGQNKISKPYCKITLTTDGVKISAYSKDSNMQLESLQLTFNDSESIDVLGHLTGDGIFVGDVVTATSLSALAKNMNAMVTAKFKSANCSFSEYELNEKNNVELDLGENLFEITVTNGIDTQTYSLIIIREDYTDSRIESEIQNIINNIKSVKWGQPANDWVLAMNAADLVIDENDKVEYLSAALHTINEFVHLGKGNAGSMAKIAIALTSLGIDVTDIRDFEGLDAPINLFDAIANDTGSLNMYSVPAILSLYDLEDGDGEKIYSLPANPKITREKLIDTIINTYQQNTGLFFDADYTGMAFTALAPYYVSKGSSLNGIEIKHIKTDVNLAIDALSKNQFIDGGFGSRNSNTTATVITGLTALGIDPHKDERFIKTGSTLITDLLSFKTSDGKLGSNSSNRADDYSCVQGFQALASYQNLVSSKNSNIYHFPAEVEVYNNWPEAKLLTSIAVTKQPAKTEYAIGEEIDTTDLEITAYYNANINNSQKITEGFTVSNVDTSTAGTKDVVVSYGGQTAKFNITVKGTGGAVPKEKTVKISVKSGEKGTIASDNAYVIEAGATTVMDALKGVLDKSGKIYVIRGGAYVSEIDGLGEFSEGENSGWMYLINGKDPVIGAHEYKLKGGESIQWIYTLDYSKESGSEKWSEDQKPAETSESTSKEKLNSIIKEINSGKRDSWSVDLAEGSITFDKGALESLVDQMGSDPVEISIEEAISKNLNSEQKEAAKDRPVYDINIKSGKKEISKFDGKLQIALPYKLRNGEKPSGIVVYHMDGSGKLTLLDGTYDPVAGKVVFTIDHLSYFLIGYDETLAKWPFMDVKESDSENWYYSAVKYTYEKGIFSGMSKTTFEPDSNLTRSMLASVLARMSGADLTKYKSSAFTDVKIDSWYGPSVAWAKEAGVVSGYANKDGSYSFKPDDKITRQDIAVMLSNYNEKVAKKTYEEVQSVDFIDNSSISAYALPAVTKMQQVGVINGVRNADGNYKFLPLNNATRAEAAMLIYNMLNK